MDNSQISNETKENRIVLSRNYSLLVTLTFVISGIVLVYILSHAFPNPKFHIQAYIAPWYVWVIDIILLIISYNLQFNFHSHNILDLDKKQIFKHIKFFKFEYDKPFLSLNKISKVCISALIEKHYKDKAKVENDEQDNTQISKELNIKYRYRFLVYDHHNQEYFLCIDSDKEKIEKLATIISEEARSEIVRSEKEI